MPIIGSQGAWQGQERLDDAARRAVQQTETESAARGHRQATSDVLLLALLVEPDGVPARALIALGLDPHALVAGIDHLVERRTPALPGRSALDSAAREAIILGVNEARRAGFSQAGAGHLLLGVVEARSPGARVLTRAGVAIGPLRGAVNDLQSANVDVDDTIFAATFITMLARIGGGGKCARCTAPLHESFRYCYNCGTPQTT